MKSEFDSGWGFELGGIRWRRIAVLGLLATALIVTSLESRDEAVCDSRPKELANYMVCVEDSTIRIFPRFGSTAYEIKNATLVLATEENIYFYRTEGEDDSLVSNFSMNPRTGKEMWYGKHRR